MSTAVQRALAAPRLEVLPTARILALVAEHVEPGREVAVTASAAHGLEATVATACALESMGMRAVPHLAARMVPNRQALEGIVATLADAGVERVFVPAGDAPPAGDYACAADLLRDLAALDAPFSQVGITGYPESHPLISDAQTIAAMADKAPFATCIVSNLCFDPAAIAAWAAAVRARGIDLELYIGIPGRVGIVKLAQIAASIGVGASARFLTHHAGVLGNLVKPGGYDPLPMLTSLEELLAEPAAAGLHIFTFNQVRATEEWRSAVVAQAG